MPRRSLQFVGSLRQSTSNTDELSHFAQVRIRHRAVRGRNDHRRPERHAIATARCCEWILVSSPIQTVLGQLRQQDVSPTYGNIRLSAVITAGRQARGIPPWCACVRPSLSTGAAGPLTLALRYFDGRTLSAGSPPRDDRGSNYVPAVPQNRPQNGADRCCCLPLFQRRDRRVATDIDRTVSRLRQDLQSDRVSVDYFGLCHTEQ